MNYMSTHQCTRQVERIQENSYQSEETRKKNKQRKKEWEEEWERKHTKPIPRYHRNEPDAYDPRDYLYDYTTSYMLALDKETSRARYAVSQRAGATRTFVRRPRCTYSLSTRIEDRVGGSFLFLWDMLLWGILL